MKLKYYYTYFVQGNFTNFNVNSMIQPLTGVLAWSAWMAL